MVVAPASMAMRTISTREVAVRPRRVFGRKLHIIDQRARQPHGFRGAIERLLAADLQLVFEMQIARGQEHVNAGALGKLHGAGGHLDVFLLGAGQRSDRGLRTRLGDRRDRREVAFRSHGEAGLDDVHAQVLKRVRHGQLFLGGHAAAGRLLAVAQRGVEKYNVIRV